MTALSEYDCAIIGEHPAGLWAAKHLLSLGKRVIIVPMENYGGGNVLPKKVAHDFSLGEASVLQIITPTRRVLLSADEQALKEEYRFNYGSELSPDLAPHPEFFRGAAYWTRGAETGPVLPHQWPQFFPHLFSTVYFDEPAGYLEDMLLRDLERSGAFIAKTGSVTQIFTDRKSVVGIQLANNAQMIAVKQIFINTHFDSVNRLLNEPLSLRSQPMGWNFEISFECSTDFLPVGITPRMIYVQENAPILEIFQEWLGRFRLKTTLPYRVETLDWGNQLRLASRMLKVCQDLLPDLQYNLKSVTPDLRDPERAVNTDLPALYPFESLKDIPPRLLTFGADAGLGSQTPVEGLCLSTDEVSPRDGIWGAYEAVVKSLEAWGRRSQSPEIGSLKL